MANSWRIEIKFTLKRMSIVKSHFKELCTDERISNPELNFKYSIFYNTIDIVTSQLKSRYTSMESLLDVLIPSNLCTFLKEILFNKMMEYSDNISDSFSHQLISFQSSRGSKIKKITCISELASLLIIKYAELSSTFPDIYIYIYIQFTFYF